MTIKVKFVKGAATYVTEGQSEKICGRGGEKIF